MGNFNFKPSSRISGVDAETAGHELERIRGQNDGRLKPGDVVAASTPKDAPLHPCFEWRNAVAAHQYRLWQSRQIIRAVVVKEVRDGKERERPAFVHCEAATPDGRREPYYQATQIAVQSIDEWTSAIMQASAKLTEAKRSLEALEKIAHKDSEQPGRMAMITIAIKALDTAAEAMRH